jgi:hypothetical protein
MATKKTDFDIDFIGNQEPLTEAEEKALNDYFKKKKDSPLNLQPAKLHKLSKKSKATV